LLVLSVLPPLHVVLPDLVKLPKLFFLLFLAPFFLVEHHPLLVALVARKEGVGVIR
jgi:hypothetical protein